MKIQARIESYAIVNLRAFRSTKLNLYIIACSPCKVTKNLFLKFYFPQAKEFADKAKTACENIVSGDAELAEKIAELSKAIGRIETPTS